MRNFLTLHSMLSNKEWWGQHWYDIDKIQPVLNLAEKRRKEIFWVMDTHHHIPRHAHSPIVWTDHKRNRTEINRWMHVARHLIFGEELPHEQDQTNFGFNEKVFAKPAKELQREYVWEVSRLFARWLLYVGKCFEKRNGVLVPKWHL